MGQAGGAGAAPSGGFAPFIPMIIIFVIFYFLLIRPQQKKAKQAQEMINNLKKGDRVVTSGGIFGRIVSLDENSVKLEIADKVQIKLNRGNISGLVEKE
ncbi:MAG: preprotein translocase subunit YajC [Proteobacteria bacterium]|nr:preprotein translocase subunit YajC [Pseudomonadota bacterium]